MKKNIFIILILFFSISINSQNTKMQFGIKSGINMSKYTPELNVENTRLADYQRKIGFYIGGYTNIKISQKFKIQPEILFSSQGTKRVFEDISLTDSNGELIISGDIEEKISESVISTPITLQYFINNEFNLEGGIQLGYIMNRKQEITKNPLDSFFGNNSQNINTNYDKFDLGFNIGLGYEVFENMRINTRYFHGLIERDGSIKPSVFSLGIEYKI
ncbi:porin family protein [Tenacibaculum tangerinum]|uniref:Porin family protein n=1 Tax=Tenacibaculum tangerinum TaxID=3038772 RepID=A0ABY8L4F9_9FLAO|nr:porin family protein [Tenacibaculum tangerinum]WGH75976.1 porin family protein [Tenacibaculum tangerinum]